MRYILILTMALGVMAGETPQRGTLSGRITDVSEARAPYVTVRATNAAGETASALSDSQGNYSLGLAPGTYALVAEAAGFETLRREGLVVEPGRVLTANITLQLAALAEQVTVTAKAPDFVDTLDIRDVKESAAKDVGEALAEVGGVWKIRKGGVANDVIVRGFQQGNINVLVDGARIYGACPNHMDPAAFHIDFAEVQEIEVTKGAFDVANQGSLGGVINIISREPSGGLRITPGLSTGSFGYYNPSMTASLSRRGTYGVGGYSFRRSAPYRDGSGRRFTEYANFKPDLLNADAFQVGAAWFKFGAVPKEGQRLELSYTRQQADDVLYPYLQMDALYDNADRWNASYHIGSLGALKQIHLQGYFTRVKHWMTDEDRLSSVGAPRPYGMATFASTKALGGRAEADIAGLNVGLETYRRNWDAVNTMRMGAMAAYMDQESIPGVNIANAGVYARYRRGFGRLELSAGARLDVSSSDARSAVLRDELYWAYKGETNRSHTDWAPSANVRMVYMAPAGFQFFAGVGHTARVPDPQERYFALKRSGSDWVGDPGLRPTRNNEVDLGINYRNGRFGVRPTVFYSRLTDFIVVYNQPRIHMAPDVMNTAARSYTNTDARMYGGELGYSVRLSHELTWLGGVSWTRGVQEILPGGNLSDTNLAEMPPVRTRGALRYGTRRFFAEIEGVASGAQRRVNRDLREQPTPGWGVLNAMAGVHTAKLNLAAGLSNLTNRFYYESVSYQRDPFRTGVKVPEPGRSVYLSVTYAF